MHILPLEDLQAQLRADPRQGSRTVQDSIRDLSHEISKLEAQLHRIKPVPEVRRIWEARVAVLDRRRRDLAALLPVRIERTARPATDQLYDPGLASVRRR